MCIRDSLFIFAERACKKMCWWTLLVSVLLDGLVELVDVSTLEGVDLSTVLEEDEGGHGLDLVGASNLGGGIDIDLDELDVGLLVREGLELGGCLLYTSPSPRDRTRSRMPSSA
eukprot:TRINITY_DN16600_c0_g1_i3.p2 TRINITY_DN16600_c0_g1~~TRINITY_DN16600_c0_g1_i3.p2  ORF type:complete len:114 (+),score=22.07 TRINITY_DN16600_c0_g1_i3:157-498(+)